MDMLVVADIIKNESPKLIVAGTNKRFMPRGVKLDIPFIPDIIGMMEVSFLNR